MGTRFAVGDGRARGPKPKSATDKLAALDLSGADFCIHGHPFDKENTRIYNSKFGVWRKCKTCEDRRSLELKRVRKKAIRWYKQTKGCTDCGETDPIVLEFDHVRGEKAFNLVESSCRSLMSVWEEIQKCDVVCANCHRRRTSAQGGY